MSGHPRDRPRYSSRTSAEAREGVRQGGGTILLLGGHAVNEQAIGSLQARARGADFEGGGGEFAAVGLGDRPGEDKLLGRLDFLGEGLIFRSGVKGLDDHRHGIVLIASRQYPGRCR
jgi:hypothetical protein